MKTLNEQPTPSWIDRLEGDLAEAIRGSLSWQSIAHSLRLSSVELAAWYHLSPSLRERLQVLRAEGTEAVLDSLRRFGTDEEHRWGLENQGQWLPGPDALDAYGYPFTPGARAVHARTRVVLMRMAASDRRRAAAPCVSGTPGARASLQGG